jgi:serine/threonine protein kinase/Tol biopolymer transport system component
MAMAAGSKIGPYEILAPLGAGGMGEVYRARDTRLGRNVAVKVLAARLATSDDSRQRFEQEARAISKLSHPHICTLYDVAREGDLQCLVMELVEGQTLTDRLAKGPLQLDEALRFGAEIASALDAAHRNGILHRDLKPGNIMLTRSGVKLLDFGLAKAFSPKARPLDSVTAPTVTASPNLTQEGAILGTLSYMAPEQVEGKRTGTPADIFALGVVLFEMLTGRRAFAAASNASLISAILTSDPPPVSSARASSPPALDRLVQTCLQKDPEQRWQSAHDVELQLQAIAAGGEAKPAAGVRPPSAAWLPWVIAGVSALIAMTTLVSSRSVQPQAAPRTIRLAEPPPATTRFVYNYENTFVALSPDGSQIAYVAMDPEKRKTALWARPLDAPEAHVIPGTENASSIFWSPDGRSLGFFTWDGKMKRVELAGGTSVPICDLGPGNWSASGSWGPDGDILFAARTPGEAIYRVPSSGGTPTALLRPDAARGEKKLGWPLILPDGRAFLYLARAESGDRSLMWMEPGGSPRLVMPLASNVQLIDPGYLVFARAGALLGQGFDGRTGRTTGAPFSIAEHVRYFQSTAYAAFAASRAGTIAYQAGADVLQPTWYDRSGRVLGTVGAPGLYYEISISPDSSRALFSRDRADIGTKHIWEIDLARRVETPVTSATETEITPVWLPDGRRFVYSAVRGADPPHLFRRDLASGSEEELTRSGPFQEATDVSPDGRTLLFVENDARGWQLPLSMGGKPVALDQPEGNQRLLRFSADGRFIAFLSEKSGSWEAYVAPYPGPGQWTRVSTNGATQLRWNRQGHEILYLTPDMRLMAVPVRTEPALSIGTPAALFTLTGSHPWQDFDVTRDGQRFLALVPQTVADDLPLRVIVGWKPNSAN